jgi:hypothetical protein
VPMEGKLPSSASSGIEDHFTVDNRLRPVLEGQHYLPRDGKTEEG